MGDWDVIFDYNEDKTVQEALAGRIGVKVLWSINTI